MTNKLVELCAVADVPEGEGIPVTVEGFPVLAVFKLGEDVYVIDDLCTHGEASLAEGEVDVECGYVECPFHQGEFDIRTGEAVTAPCVKPVKSYAVTVQDGKVFIPAADSAAA